MLVPFARSYWAQTACNILLQYFNDRDELIFVLEMTSRTTARCSSVRASQPMTWMGNCCLQELSRGRIAKAMSMCCCVLMGWSIRASKLRFRNNRIASWYSCITNVASSETWSLSSGTFRIGRLLILQSSTSRKFLKSSTLPLVSGGIAPLDTVSHTWDSRFSMEKIGGGRLDT